MPPPFTPTGVEHKDYAQGGPRILRVPPPFTPTGVEHKAAGLLAWTRTGVPPPFTPTSVEHSLPKPSAAALRRAPSVHAHGR